ncbi:uracil phosphoribosyltransferase [Cyclobacterium qasimii]|uniref:Uracil phosphoribosyltransferase n=2 Tax=Cyclobacterium qasimii TaxID=1350429 RepID=S7WQC7_9BACT|nr:uracil phosphoribosyltransferase [Cyclobacterium qasimii]EPR68959.1 Uracil phosphoribosyltransferase [Cyclobacterium qasimii M12-11B]GEO23909.1 uracil phosphoribosyltransferase [Cyclobacterium qasimii]
MFILNQNNSIANHYLAELRDIHVQKDRMRFRKNLERLGEILAYEVSKQLPYSSASVSSPFGKVETPLIKDQPIIIAVLRAAVPFYQGVLNLFDQSDSGFIGAYRNEAEDEIEITLNYMAAPDLTGKTVIMVDPMLATGKSFLKSIQALKKNGIPKQIEVVSAIAAPEGIKHIQDNLDLPHRFWIGAVDDKLNQQSYIIPGLGDAGDLAFGSKI